MTGTVGMDVRALDGAMTGVAIGPDDPRYDEARRVWNGDVDRRPAVIARCASAADVGAALAVARGAGREVTVRGGGHSITGASIADDAVMIDLSVLDTVSVDPAARIARVGGGATLAQMDAATQVYGLATPGGTVSHTGVAGLTLGGGMGWLTSRFGLAVDNLLGVQIVTADGQVRRAAADENPDLFWAVRGGGGNFGVVTEFEFRLHEVDPLVQLGFFFWPHEQTVDVLRIVREIAPGLPRELNLAVVAVGAPPAPYVPASMVGMPGCGLVLVGFGGDAHARCTALIKERLPVAFDLVTPMPYVALQQMFDAGNPWGVYAYEKGLYLDDPSDDVGAAIAEHMGRSTSPMTAAILLRLDGAYCEVPEDATAFSGGRTPRYMVFVLGLAPDSTSLGAERDWVRSLWGALQPYATGASTYVNSVAPRDQDRVRAAYGDKYERLARIKATYDPENVFHHNGNIVPATRPVEPPAPGRTQPAAPSVPVSGGEYQRR
jgi:hypothetical protein